jgi:hypothetical protein
MQVWTNGVACNISEQSHDSTATNPDDTGFKEFVVYLPALCRVSIYVANTGAANTTVRNAVFNIKGAN